MKCKLKVVTWGCVAKGRRNIASNFQLLFSLVIIVAKKTLRQNTHEKNHEQYFATVLKSFYFASMSEISKCFHASG